MIDYTLFDCTGFQFDMPHIYVIIIYYHIGQEDGKQEGEISKGTVTALHIDQVVIIYLLEDKRR